MGELQVRGTWVIRFYFKTNNRENLTEDGWFRTGDVSTIDSEGYMEITECTKDLVKNLWDSTSTNTSSAYHKAHRTGRPSSYR
ncbi:hypothetical protein [Pricia sp.]|uniref:hypothetical protein n=1 Tax=Pricia sp. TaxID=2268138 RepID=UPI003592EAD2